MVMIVRNLEIKEGYKRTEVGILPEDWEVDNLKQFWAVIDCKHVTAKFVENGIPLASIREVQSRFVELDNAKQTTQFYYLALIEGGRKPQLGDLIFSRNATVGEIAQVAEWHPSFAMGQDVCLLRKKHLDFSSYYLQAIVRSPIILKQLANFMVGSTFKRVNVKQIQNLIVPMPLPKEQIAIATVFSDIDTLIEALDKLIVKKRDIKQATMQQLLTGKTRLPGFSGEWEIRQFGDIFQFLSTANNSRSDLSDQGDIKYIHYGDIHTKWRSFVDCSRDHLPFINRNRVVNVPFLEDGDLVMADASEDCEGIGISVEVKNATGKKVIAGLHTFLLRGDKEVLADGFKGFLQYIPSLKASLKKAATGISVYGISKNNVRNISISLPRISEQQAIATVLTDMDAEIAALEQKREKTRMMKQGMMQELLTGKIRLV